MNLLFIILATLGAGFTCIYSPAPDWVRIVAFIVWALLTADFVLYNLTNRTLLDHIQNK
jgi:hypothetical protein